MRESRSHAERILTGKDAAVDAVLLHIEGEILRFDRRQWWRDRRLFLGLHMPFEEQETTDEDRER